MPRMSQAARVRIMGRISLAELQARSPKRYKRKPKPEVPRHVRTNELERWAKHKGVEVTKRSNYISIKLG